MRTIVLTILALAIVLMNFIGVRAPADSKECYAMDDDITKLVQSIDDNPDPLHADDTPSVHRLIEKGLPSVSPVLMLMMSESQHTRMRAQRVLEGVTVKQFGFVAG
jgi:hypothetical protein